MTKEIRRLSIIVVFMFVALFASTSIIQVVHADSLASDPNNRRTLYDSYEVRRGPIIAGGTQIARSQSSDDLYAFQRMYEDPEMWASVTGFFNPALGSASGIEQAMNQELSGFANSAFLARLEQIISGQAPRGSSVELSLDPEVQRAAYEAMVGAGYSGAVVAIEPDSGRVLGLVSTPGFDTNALSVHDGAAATETYDALAADESDPLVNRATSQWYPPGSTFKLVVASAALASGDYTPDSTFDNLSAYELPGTSTNVYNASRGTCGGGDEVTLATAISLSCNVPMAELAVELGDEAIREQAEKFGYNADFSIPLAVTASNYPADLSDDQTGLTGFGQGQVVATPLEVALTTAGIANDGVVMQPTMVDQILGDDLSVQESTTASEWGRALEADEANAVTDMMVSSVAEGAATGARIEGVDVAGKTGTAENADGDPYTLWFTGFAPADDPQVAVAVVVEDGGGVGQTGSGNTIAAPIAKKVMEAVLAQ
ncbi:penicillin-binding transpeptidase domain-containing protein [Microbacterium excoecariae]|uniref:penicillin-binding transpeptidase domain-containing protein n=1 Tax=Microbacterium excoecariae TaxID=2715210 RepID=UPI00140A3294|nr:penicillin-binding transpeptidase domain-containing protein [Microbacterium excoecariae]NHI15914.1 penicillin-binding protein 2 [Microbacterium excoecariae]